MYRPRLSAELTPTQHQRLLQILPFGLQKPLFQVLVNGIIELYDKGGIEALSLITTEYLNITFLIDLGLKHSKQAQIKELEKRLKELKP